MIHQLQITKVIIISIGIVLMASCTEDKTPYTGSLYSELNPAESGIQFSNDFVEDEDHNWLVYDVVYNGGGVGIGDINNDGLPDIYFTGNQVPDALYLNKGNLKFEDISKESGIGTYRNWSSSVAMADVNGDGWLDIYVCKYLYINPDLRKNLLFINQQDGSFKEMAEDYGVADPGYSTAANFIDYDLDGDLDLYVGNQFSTSRLQKRKEAKTRNFEFTDNFYRNDGGKGFTKVTQSAGVQNYAACLSVTQGDLDNDGWPDLYVANDYEEPDFYYRNNGNGSFTNVANVALKHMSNFSMGVDIADFNNDGALDLFVADMVAKDNYRLKTNMSGMDPKKFWSLVKNGYHHQYMFNALQLNNGHGFFSEIAQMAGVAWTDWSWSALFMDMDLDGYRDLYITNGSYRDTRNNDYGKWLKEKTKEHNKLAQTGSKDDIRKSTLALAKESPQVPIANYAFQNSGDLEFKNRAEEWSLGKVGYTHGAAYADLDQDGDLDLVVNNLGEPATVYISHATEAYDHHWLEVSMTQPGANHHSIGAKVNIYYGDEQQAAEIQSTRGYHSCSEPIAHFGLQAHNKIDRLVARWPDGAQIELTDVRADQHLTLSYDKASRGGEAPLRTAHMFKPDTAVLAHRHIENNYDDYAREILLPYKLSELGPTVTKGDINGDGLEDIWIGGSSGQAGTIYLQSTDGKLVAQSIPALAADKIYEDMDAAIADIDGDGDMDLYVVSGGSEWSPGSPNYRDRIYIQENNRWSLSSKMSETTSGSVVRPADIDGDGDVDLLVAGRQVPGQYGATPRTVLYINKEGQLVNNTSDIAPELEQIGMVTDAQWLDVEGDGDLDVMLVGEWMPIRLLVQEGGKLISSSSGAGLENSEGWWNTLQGADIDGDGDTDYIAGNLGYNLKYKASPDEPFILYQGDFDENGTHDVYLGYYDSDGVCYPVRGRQCSSQQMPFIKKEFENYDAFGKASITEVLGRRAEGVQVQQVKNFASAYIENHGDGSFTMHELPTVAQIAPIYGVAIDDYTGDGIPDVFVAGNFHGREVETTRSDAGTGVLLKGDGTGRWEPMMYTETGIFADGDVRDVISLDLVNGNKALIIANNNEPFESYRIL